MFGNLESLMVNWSSKVRQGDGRGESRGKIVFFPTLLMVIVLSTDPTYFSVKCNCVIPLSVCMSTLPLVPSV